MEYFCSYLQICAAKVVLVHEISKFFTKKDNNEYKRSTHVDAPLL